MLSPNVSRSVVCAILSCGLLTSLASAEEFPAKVSRHEAKNGDSYFALELQLDQGQTDESSRDHVVIVDTSASQTGEHRIQSLAVLKSFLSSLPDGDRVSLMAVDVMTEPLTDGFVTVGSKEADAAYTELTKRVPLGATNMLSALKAAAGQFDGKNRGSLFYIGDGMSTANLLASEELGQTLSGLRKKQVAMHSFAVGPRKDLRMLGICAQHTGGLVVVDDIKSQASLIGKQFARGSHMAVFYPENIVVEKTGSLSPTQALPVRSDRTTVYLGKGKISETALISQVGSFNQKSTELTWRVKQVTSTKANAFLATMWNKVQADKGLSPLAGNDMLNMARHEFDASIDNMLQLGQLAVARRQHKDAERIGLQIQSVDPGNVDAKALLSVANKLKVRTVSQVQPPNALENSETPANTDDEGLINQIEEIRRLRGEQLRLQISRDVQEARELAGDDPDAALTLLKQARGAVRAATDINPDLRLQLDKRLQGVLIEIRNQKDVNQEALLRQQERVAVLEAERRLIEQMQLEDEKLEQLIDRVRALIDEGVRGNDAAYQEAESVAEAAVNLRPGNGVAELARVTSEASGQLAMAFRWRALRADRFLETLEQVEISHVAFPDEPPIRWPPAEVWKALSERRKKWASVDLHKASPAEERIRAALRDQTEFEFADNPLRDVMTYLSDLHNINIQLMDQDLSEEGIDPDEPINLQLSGITLRSALKLILEPLGLTYVIEDEVMKITTEIVAEEKLSTRVYPVGDLVVPLAPPGGGIGGIGGGGQQGGGFGQQGGGQQGGGIGGGGFSIPPMKLPKKGAKANKPVGLDAEARDILDKVLDRKTSSIQQPVPYFAQIDDPLPKSKKPFKFDNESIKALKKKTLRVK